MGRPSKINRDQAVEQAMGMIWANGYEQASVLALSGILGITRSSFYNAFGSREALMAEVLARYVQISPDAPLQAPVPGPVLPLLTAVMRDICRVRGGDTQGRGCIIVNTITEVCPSPDEPGPMLAALMLGSIHRIEALMAQAQAGGELPITADPRALALALQNLIVGLNVLCKVVPDEASLWLLTETTLRGLGLLHQD
jgi:TetR/AcrR family transcriptional repressor of nem operon